MSFAKIAKATPKFFGPSSGALGGMSERDRDIERLVAAISQLSEDVNLASSLPESQFARRAWARAVFALLECNTNLMAELVLKANGRGEVALSPAEYAVLREESYRLASNGREAKSHPSFSPLRARFRFVVERFAKLYAVEFELACGGSGWSAFSDAVNVRNRITHPSTVDDFRISRDDIDSIEDARKWYVDEIERLLAAIPDDA
jgi:hypothetical protein